MEAAFETQAPVAADDDESVSISDECISSSTSGTAPPKKNGDSDSDSSSSDSDSAPSTSEKSHDQFQEVADEEIYVKPAEMKTTWSAQKKAC